MQSSQFTLISFSVQICAAEGSAALRNTDFLTQVWFWGQVDSALTFSMAMTHPSASSRVFPYPGFTLTPNPAFVWFHTVTSAFQDSETLSFQRTLAKHRSRLLFYP